VGVRGFVGRSRELGELGRELETARSGSGRFVTVRGRRQVGKSWLVSEFVERYGGPRLFFQGHGYTETRELERFRAALAASNLPSAPLAGAGVAFTDWEGALLAAASGATADHPSIIILDEFPDLCERRRSPDGEILSSPQEGSIRAAWTTLEQLPVVLVLIGSDLSMMERLTVYGAPLFQRPTRELLVPPLSPLEVARLTGRSGADALDAYLVTGGFPKIARLWSSGDLGTFLKANLADPGSELVRSAARILDAELPANVNARSILSVIGAGERTNAGVSARTGIRTTNLTVPRGPLTVLAEKRLVASALPVSTARSAERRYWVADPYLRFWLRFIEPALSEIERGLGATVAPSIARDFGDYRGRAIEPLVRDAVARLSIAGDPTLGGARAVGAFWTRDNSVEIDLVGADREAAPAGAVAFVGTIKWRDRTPVAGSDIADLVRGATRIPGVDAATPLVAVSRSGFDRIAAPIRQIEPDEILAAFPAD
jgi:AAA+ ATPase superfamily predicted ATPase